MQKPWLSLAVLAFCCQPLCWTPAQAGIIHRSLDFNAPTQTLWGSGGSVGFEFEGDWSFSVLGLDFDMGYKLGTNSGSVSARFNGDLVIDRPSFVGSTGIHNLNLSFLGDSGGGTVKSDLGAWAEASLGLTVRKDYGLNINSQFTPELDTLVTGSDSATALTIKVAEVVAARAGVDFDVQQTLEFEATSISGNLLYTRRGSGVNNTVPFTLDTDGGLSLPVNLDAVGTWDFWFEDQTLNNSFSTSFDLALVLFEEHLEMDLCRGFLGIPYPCRPHWDRNDHNAVDISVYDPAAFELDFNTIATLDSFSIRVLGSPINGNPDPDIGNGNTVPEPDTLALLASALLGFAWTQQKKRSDRVGSTRRLDAGQRNPG